MKYIDAEFLANIFLEEIEHLANEAYVNNKEHFDLHYFMTQDTKAFYIGVVDFTSSELSRITPYIWKNIIASKATFMALRQINKSEVGFRFEFMEDNILRIFLPKREHHNLYEKYM